MSDQSAVMIQKGNGRSSGYDRQAQDWYVEPRRAVEALLDVEVFEGGVWDPACGGGNIPRACSDRGIEAVGSDIIDRGYGIAPNDFLVGPFFPAVRHVISNPPFGIAVEFTTRALALVDGKVAILQRTSWLEGERRYQALFAKGHLMRMWQFRSRISMPPGDSGSEPKGGSVSFAWFVFSAAHSGPWSGGWLP